METKIYLLIQKNRITDTQREDHVLGVYTTKALAQNRLKELYETADQWAYDIYEQMWDEENEEEPEIELSSDSLFVSYPEACYANSYVDIIIKEVTANTGSEPWLNTDYIK